jgi:hypothetical protein
VAAIAAVTMEVKETIVEVKTLSKWKTCLCVWEVSEAGSD